jgi:hypothetical protein
MPGQGERADIEEDEEKGRVLEHAREERQEAREDDVRGEHRSEQRWGVRERQASSVHIRWGGHGYLAGRSCGDPDSPDTVRDKHPGRQPRVAGSFRRPPPRM